MILVFAGAGASASVDQEKYLTTEKFFEQLPDDIKDEPWCKEAYRFLSDRNKSSIVDVEDLLEALGEVRDYFEVSLKTDSFPGWMLAPNTGRLRNIDRNNRGSLSDDYLRSLVYTYRIDRTSIDSLRNRINALIYSLYAGRPDKSKLADWRLLLVTLAEWSQVTEVFTTNYDLVLETVIGQGGLKKEIETGRVNDDIGTRLDLACWNAPDEPTSEANRRGMLTKLHGSVDWQRESDGEIVVGASQLSGSDENRVVLYPGHKGDPEREPFIAFHNHLRSVVQEADAAIFIGYAFRDRYINQVLSDLSSDAPKYIFYMNKAPSEQGFLKDAVHFSEGFTQGFVKACIASLLKHNILSVDDN